LLRVYFVVLYYCEIDIARKFVSWKYLQYVKYCLIII